MTAHIDILPTLVDLCNLKTSKPIQFDGMSLGRLLRQVDQDWPDRVLVVHSQRIEHPEKWRRCSVMTQNWRLVNKRELYDINADPGQQNDCAGENPEVVTRLREEYEAWWTDLSERFEEYCNIVIGSDEQIR